MVLLKICVVGSGVFWFSCFLNLVLGNTPAERQRNQKLVDSNNQDYARIDKSKGEDFCSGTNCYGKATQKRLEESPVNPNTVVTIVNKKNSNRIMVIIKLG